MQKKKIAIVGGGISGVTAAYILQDNYDITLFEKSDYLGGHTHTIEVDRPSGRYAIDTGFIVFNKETYPNFIKLLNKLNVDYQPSDMSFGFRSDRLGLEYSARTLNGLFTQRKNLLSPSFYRLLYDIKQFNHKAKTFLKHEPDCSLQTFIDNNHFSDWFLQSYLWPMAASIWSSPADRVADFSTRFLAQFYENHGLLNMMNHLQWYAITGGSQRYIDKLQRAMKAQIYLSSPVTSVSRGEEGISIVVKAHKHHFDYVIMACHSDQALKLLSDPTSTEKTILSQLPYYKNNVTLHTDTSILPQKRSAWASWNYLDQNNGESSLTYYMNLLQSLDAPEDFFVSVNCPDIIESKILGRYQYDHPAYTLSSMQARQKQLALCQDRTFFIGAYWGNGFHEDGVKSALDGLASLGGSL